MSDRLPKLGVDMDDVIGDFLSGFFPWCRLEYPNEPHGFIPPGPDEIDRHSFDLSISLGPPPAQEISWLAPIHRYTVESSMETMLL